MLAGAYSRADPRGRAAFAARTSHPAFRASARTPGAVEVSGVPARPASLGHGRGAQGRTPRGPHAAARRCPSGAPRGSTSDLERDALTAPPPVLTIHRSKGSKRKDSRVDEEALIVWQDVLDMVVNGRPNEVACPHCNHRPLTIEEVDQSTRISCSKCGKFIQGRFTH